MNEVDAGRDRASPASVGHDADEPPTPIEEVGGREGRFESRVAGGGSRDEVGAKQDRRMLRRIPEGGGGGMKVENQNEETRLLYSMVLRTAQQSPPPPSYNI